VGPRAAKKRSLPESIRKINTKSEQGGVSCTDVGRLLDTPRKTGARVLLETNLILPAACKEIYQPKARQPKDWLRGRRGGKGGAGFWSRGSVTEALRYWKNGLTSIGGKGRRTKISGELLVTYKKEGKLATPSGTYWREARSESNKMVLEGQLIRGKVPRLQQTERSSNFS